jgi:hypothetical protein
LARLKAIFTPADRAAAPHRPQDAHAHATPRAVGIAFAMCAAAGLCTVLGGALVYTVKATNHRFLSASLGLAAGVMVVSAPPRRAVAAAVRPPPGSPPPRAPPPRAAPCRARAASAHPATPSPPPPRQYISFVEIFSVKAVGAFEEAGLPAHAAERYATFGFFAGVALTWLLDKAADKLVGLAERLQLRRAKVGGAGRREGARGGEPAGGDPGAEQQTRSASASPPRRLTPAVAGAAPAQGGLPVDSHATLTLTDVEASGSGSGSGSGKGGAAAGAFGLGKDAAAAPRSAQRRPACADALCGAPGLCAACAAAAGGDGSSSDGEDGIMAIISSDAGRLSRLGLLAALAVGIHNLPEGAAGGGARGSRRSSGSRVCWTLAWREGAAVNSRRRQPLLAGLCRTLAPRPRHLHFGHGLALAGRRHCGRHRAAQPSRGHLHRAGACGRGGGRGGVQGRVEAVSL